MNIKIHSIRTLALLATLLLGSAAAHASETFSSILGGGNDGMLISNNFGDRHYRDNDGLRKLGQYNRYKKAKQYNDLRKYGEYKRAKQYNDLKKYGQYKRAKQYSDLKKYGQYKRYEARKNLYR
ncbi:MAG: hypothetical protein ACRC6D_10080 [Aeromonas sp.]